MLVEATWQELGIKLAKSKSKQSVEEEGTQWPVQIE
jgi:hypothetical protein